jgi:hypothetical protein
MSNVARDYKEKIGNAKLNAIYKHMNRGGGSDAIVEASDFDITYFTTQVKIVKEDRSFKDKNGVMQKRRYAYALDRDRGKQVFRPRIIRKGDVEEFK